MILQSHFMMRNDLLCILSCLTLIELLLRKHENIIQYITVAATDRNIFVMSTVVYTPAAVSTVENVSLSSHTRHIIQPNRSSAGAVSVSQCLANVPVQMCNYITNTILLITVYIYAELFWSLQQLELNYIKQKSKDFNATMTHAAQQQFVIEKSNIWMPCAINYVIR